MGGLRVGSPNCVGALTVGVEGAGLDQGAPPGGVAVSR